MRINRLAVGIVLAAAVALTGCSGGAPEGKPTETPKCPELKEGARFDGAALGSCIAETAESIAGYAMTTTIMGQTTPAKIDPADRALETTGPIGALILIGDKAWVKPTSGAWQVADPSSDDQSIAGLSMTAPTIAQSSPTARASLLTGELSVTGTGKRLGEQVFLIPMSGKDASGPVETLFEVTKDFAPLAMTTTTTTGGTKTKVIRLVTEWDVDQKIAPPL